MLVLYFSAAGMHPLRGLSDWMAFASWNQYLEREDEAGEESYGDQNLS